nr:RNA-directed DNA polymerase, eukaryota, reverse transcriptase zinc-binding domain protein [Tanacetum cinerariifolium]
MSSIKAWDGTISKMKKRLSRWKLNTLSVGGRLTLLKSVLGSTPIYNMSIFKVLKSVLNLMESLRMNFFNGTQDGDRKIALVKWSKVLASKKYGGLGVSSFYALNRALLFKWVWRYLSHDNSLWSRVISAIHGLNGQVLSAAFNSTWSSIINEVNSLKDKCVDLITHCKIKVGKGTCTSFWNDIWIGDSLLKLSFPRLYALEEKKHISVADKMRTSISFSFRRPVRGGVESQQHDHLSDRWFWDLNGDGVFRVKDVRILLDDAFLSKMEVPTRWIKSIPIKVNVFAWKLFLDRLPTRSNLARRNVSIPSLACPLCDHALEDSSHLFFGCFMAKYVQKLICGWWNLDFQYFDSYDGWLSWFKSIRFGPEPITPLNEGTSNQKSKSITEGHTSALKELLNEPSNRDLVKPMLLDFEDVQDVSDEEFEDGAKGKEKVGNEDLSKPFKEDVQQTLDSKARAWFDKLPPGNNDNWGSLQEKFLNRFGMLKACDKDPTEISKIICRANETLPHFKERWVSESNAIPNVPELMQISSFMSSHKCPELAKRFFDNVPKTMDEMLKRVDDYLRSEEAFRNTKLPRGEFSRKDAPAQWVQRGDRPQRYHYGNNRRRQEHIYAFRAPERSILYVLSQRSNQEVHRPRAVLTLDSLSSTPQEILATEHRLRLPQPAPLVGVPS